MKYFILHPKFLLSIFIPVLLFIISCKKHQEDPIPKESASLQLSIHTTVNGQSIIKNSGKYVTANSDTFTITTLKYYLTNIQLQKTDGSIFKVPESYHLINAASGTDTKLILTGIPDGEYEKIMFFIGVDSLRNHSGAQTGDLDPTVYPEMYWGWSEGYRAMIFYGTYKATSGYKSIVYEIGGDVNKKVVSFDKSSKEWKNIIIQKEKLPQISLQCNVEEIFKNPLNINLTTTNVVECCEASKTIANNYADMFSLTSIILP